MQNLLYYPGFEIQDQRWLKFALLYLEEISTIVPMGGDHYVSDLYTFIEQETGLLKRYRPDYMESEKSSRETIEVIEKYINNPSRNFGILGRVNVIDHWRTRENQNFELFFSKFSYDFEQFCLDQGFAHRSENGISLPYQFGVIYMSILAHNIGEHNNVSVITDIKEHNMVSQISQNTWKFNKRYNEFKAIKKTIELNLPRNIDSISVDEIIDFRNKTKYQSKLKAFREAVSKLNDLHGGNMSEVNMRHIISEIEEVKIGLSSEIFNLCSTVSQVGLGIFLTLGPNVENLEFIKELLGIGFILTGSRSLINSFNNEQRQASQYLTQIRRFPGPRKNNRNIII
ncbi:hypothetical protein [Paenibacillus pseudetheri]|uniref:Uncharacterized protein n=1 Tax=Paenibacillus pseudetheri TaxID=2897682 RepID=A0ABN8FLB4_9BACL|nr:hypothetical protein [Paenibacillus pseudetheri]CAH1057247.1 hypothetical protein PAECIP111894_03405 [Paenibacillus pseudetheri]